MNNREVKFIDENGISPKMKSMAQSFSFKAEVSIGGISLGISKSPFIIAEIGLNHNNDLDIGKKTIQAAKKCGASAVKFQSYITDEFISPDVEDAKFLYNIFKQFELSEKMHRVFQQTAQEEGILFFSTPLCPNSVHLLKELKVPVIKIASGDVVNYQLLEICAETGIPLILSTGASNLEEILSALDFLQKKNVKDLILLHCISEYPAPPEVLNLDTLRLFQEIFPGPIGFSDHSIGETGAVMALGLGARVFEKHFTLDKKLPGPDHSMSSDPLEFAQYTSTIHSAYKMIGNKKRIPTEKEAASYYFGRRSLYVGKNEELIALRPNLSVKDREVAGAEKYLELKNRKFQLKPYTPVKISGTT